MRKSWNQYFMDLAKMVATRSTCPRLSVGAIFIRNNTILTTGYNGAPRGLPHCVDCHLSAQSCNRVIHAEMNGIIQAARHGISLDGSTVFVTHSPCENCAGALINAGVSQVFYDIVYKQQDYSWCSIPIQEVIV